AILTKAMARNMVCAAGAEHSMRPMTIMPKKFQTIRTIVTEVVDPIQLDVNELKRQMYSLTTDIDQFLHIVRNHEQE
ncbi:MAG: hypothetical protein V1778_01155, partial [bacterium]